MPTDFASGLGPIPNLGAEFQLGQDNAAARVFAQQQKDQLLLKQQQQSTAINSLLSKPKLTARDIFNASAVLDKDKSAQITSGFEALTKEQQTTSLSFSGKVMSAFEMGEPKIASDLLLERSEAARNTGDEESARFYEALAKNAEENPKAAQLTLGMLTAHMPGGKEVLDAISKRAGEGLGTQDPVVRSEILPDGTVQLIRKSGAVEVKEAKEADKSIIEQARKFGAGIQGLRSGERKGATEAVKASIEAFNGLSGIRKNIANMREGVRLLEEGAKTGAVEGRLPSVRAASIKLDNLQGRLGLDIIGAVTFGALSESELAFAKDTALPKTLNEVELTKWFKEKITAQEKTSANLEEAAIFLGEPGNSVAEFLKIKKAEREDRAEEQPAQQRNVVVDF